VLHPISAILYASLGEAYYQWYQLEEARRNFQHALHLSALGGSNTITIFCHVLLSRLSQIEGKLKTAAFEIQKAIDLIPLEAPEYVRQEVVSQQVRIYLALNRPAAAEIALQGQGFSNSNQTSFFDLPADRTASRSSREGISASIRRLYNSVLGLFFYQARAKNDAASLKSCIEFAGRVIAGAFKSQQLTVALESLLLRAQMYSLLGEQSSSTQDYIKALELAEPEGFIGVFVEAGPPVAEALADLLKQNQLGSIPPEYIERILDAFNESRMPSYQQPSTDFPATDRPVRLVEALTDRELDVLHLMAKGLKYKEIAERLFISLNTVRYHVKAIYGKLNVSNRLQAIELAHKLRLL